MGTCTFCVSSYIQLNLFDSCKVGSERAECGNKLTRRFMQN
jgi:hypothetical protein